MLRVELLTAAPPAGCRAFVHQRVHGQEHQDLIENNAGNYTDWLELYNPTATAVTLGNATAGQSYYLTNVCHEPDNAGLPRWREHRGRRVPGHRLRHDAVGRTRAYTNTTVVGSWPIGTTQYYTGFNLPASGGYVALVQPDGLTIASQYSFPQQLADVPME